MASAWYAKQMARANREVLETFRLAQAFTPGAAIVPPAWPEYDARQIFGRLARNRVLVPTADRRYHLDEARSAEYQRRISLLVVICLVVVSVITIALFVVFPI